MNTHESTTDYFTIAFQEAEAAFKRGEVPVGAVIVSAQGEVIASEGNRMRELSDPTAHAEVLALRSACTKMNSDRLPGFDLYVTLEPCTMCAAAISFARIRRVYFSAQDVKGGAVENGVCFFGQTTCHHAPDVYYGFHEQKSKDMLRRFFQSLRDK